LEAKDNALRERDGDEDAHNSQTGEKHEGRDDEGTSQREGHETGNPKMANFWKEMRKEEQEWKLKFAKLEQHYDLFAGASQPSN
jgi:hypothetical protein